MIWAQGLWMRRKTRSQFGTTFLDRFWRLYPDAAISVGYDRVARLLVVPSDAAVRSSSSF
jgi:hypothetical protein